MKKLILAILASSAIGTVSAHADSNPSADASASTVSGANSASGSIAKAGGGDASAVLNAAPTNATAGIDQNLKVAPVQSSNQTLELNNARAAPTGGTAISPGLVASAIFTPPNPQTNALGAPLDFAGIQACQEKLGTGVEAVDTKFADGYTGKTLITFDSVDRASQMPDKQKAHNEWGVTPLFDVPEVAGHCAGFVQIISKPGDAPRVTLATEIGDVEKFLNDNVRSPTGMYIVMMPQAVSMPTLMTLVPRASAPRARLPASSVSAKRSSPERWAAPRALASRPRARRSAIPSWSSFRINLR